MTPEYSGYLAHHGVKGQKWGVRRYQNEDGTLTADGRKRLYSEKGNLTKYGKKALIGMARQAQDTEKGWIKDFKRIKNKEGVENYRRGVRFDKELEKTIKKTNNISREDYEEMKENLRKKYDIDVHPRQMKKWSDFEFDNLNIDDARYVSSRRKAAVKTFLTNSALLGTTVGMLYLYNSDKK